MNGNQHISRRTLLSTAAATGAGGLAAGAAGTALTRPTSATASTGPALACLGTGVIPFHGTHQAGITTALQACGHLAAFDLVAGAGRQQAAALLRRWSASAEAMTAGHPPATDDDQVALDSGLCSLTVTFGFGLSLFPKTGLTHRVPAAMVPVPPFPGDALDPERSDGDLWIQIGANDPLVAFHALNVLQRQAAPTATLRWQMNGFNRTPGATDQPRTMRNLMGQIDGTDNPKPDDKNFNATVFTPNASGAKAWMNGGSYAVVRRIRMLLPAWNALPLAEQERVIGRRKRDGAPLSGGTETTPVDLEKFNPDGSLAIPPDAHVRVAAPASNADAAMLRRGFSYHDGYPADGSPDAGLLFVAWQADPTLGFVQVQRKLAGGDHLSRFIRHEAGALFAVPGGPRPGEYVGQQLLEG
ncbi:iron uptake transporter deferrochelatase/peroxidase subunit [Streptacidiphilus anmyonensis]|uniref:iron uptake transporter deferrochelatase/peroxidase subunit n=1 Tax=Streptacidiphilus anmyonensis TaxID=405782 RepID=UPI0005AA8991|nr:iron uptake transporter deferrochelatase/peroxidase subunit [Streptacidiphilus anmyonensis]